MMRMHANATLQTRDPLGNNSNTVSKCLAPWVAMSLVSSQNLESVANYGGETDTNKHMLPQRVETERCINQRVAETHRDKHTTKKTHTTWQQAQPDSQTNPIPNG